MRDKKNVFIILIAAIFIITASQMVFAGTKTVKLKVPGVV
jgi:hypothetical protein